MNARLRRGACPALSQPMATGDGLLVRMTPTGATMSCQAFAALCAAARSCGNGVIEITSRGSLQIRGMTENSAQQFATAVGSIEVPFCEGPPVLINPLTGLDPDEALDMSAIAAELRRALAAAAFSSDIGPKVCIALDGGGVLHLDAVAADVRMQTEPGGACLVGAAGDAESVTPLGAVATEDAVEAVMAIVRVIAAAGPMARARDIIAAHGAEAFCQAIADILIDHARPPRRTAAEPIGAHALRDGSVGVGLGLAFGHADASALEELTHAAATAGAMGLRTAPGRALLVLGIPRHGAARLAEMAQRLGFIVRPEDPRRKVIACAGAPVCAAGEIATRALAPVLARMATVAGAPMVHVSGCAKGCACPRSMPLTVVGMEGRCGVVVNGSARDEPVVILGPEALPDALSRVADAVRRMRAADENSAEVLSRLDRGQVARLMLGEMTDA
ncbi:MAG TPA: precorrin-3B synthase [Xanthobacteraceae bacterium]